MGCTHFMHKRGLKTIGPCIPIEAILREGKREGGGVLVSCIVFVLNAIDPCIPTMPGRGGGGRGRKAADILRSEY